MSLSLFRMTLLMPMLLATISVGAWNVHVFGNDLTINVQSFGKDYSDAVEVKAYETLNIQAVLKAGYTKQDHLNEAFRVVFSQVSGADVSSVTWSLQLPPNEKKFSYIMWPASIIWPGTSDSCDCFQLLLFEDFSINHKKTAIQNISRGNFKEAGNSYDEFTRLCEIIPEEYQSRAGSVAYFRHSFLRDLLEAARKFQAKSSWGNLAQAEKETSLALIDQWSLKLVTDNEGKNDEDSLRRLMEATSLWWKYAVWRYVRLTQTWRAALYADDAAFVNPSGAKSFHNAFDQVQQCFRNPDVFPTIDAQVNATVRGASPSLKEKLLVWQRWKNSAAQDISQITLGGFEEMIDGLYTIYAPLRETGRLGCIKANYQYTEHSTVASR
jgi:hypothetical protein